VFEEDTVDTGADTGAALGRLTLDAGIAVDFFVGILLFIK
jgi:hypothetical protein